MITLSIINYKGGVGKTTLTANLALGLANQGHRVLAVDLDPQTNLTFSFISPDLWVDTYEKKRTLKTWFEHRLKNKAKPIGFKQLAIPVAGISLISSHLELVNIDMELAATLYTIDSYTPWTFSGSPSVSVQAEFAKRYQRVYSYLLQEMATLAKHYDVVLFDCPPNFSVVTQNAMLASDFYVIPSKMDYLSTLGINQLRRRQIDASAKYQELTGITREPAFLGVIPTMVSIRSNQFISAHQEHVANLAKHHMPLFDSYLREHKTAYADNPVTAGHMITRKTEPHIVAELNQLVDELFQKIGGTP